MQASLNCMVQFIGTSAARIVIFIPTPLTRRICVHCSPAVVLGSAALILLFHSVAAAHYEPEADEFFTHDWKKMPRCQEAGCKSYLRPDATLFMESLPTRAWSKAERAVTGVRALLTLFKTYEFVLTSVMQLHSGDVMIVVGTSGVVYPAASLPEEAMRMPGVNVIEVNPEPSAISSGCVIRNIPNLQFLGSLLV